MTPPMVRAASTAANTAMRLWVHRRSRRLSKRSASTPLQAPNSRTGRNCRAVTKPRADPLLWVRRRTSHPWATACIHVPVMETSWPVK